ncbi:MAG: glycosyltransferase family 2 protein [Chloroflexota bacterium]|nr:glycosyltransferase family 2 protein [Chloroflexota bacterium]
MKRMDIIVPVASFEPISVVRKSFDCISCLENGGMDVRVVYVLDTHGENDDRLEFLRGMPVTVIARTDNRGRRAGAINDALDVCKSEGEPDYVALFDVDSRPDWNFLVACVDRLQNRCAKNVIIASGARFITNEDENIVTKTVAAEYCFFSDVYRLFERFGGFNQFNGMIGVLDIRLMRGQLGRLDESVSCEDLEFTQKAYLEGFAGGFTAYTMVGEQAPTSIRDLFNQRVRWLSGGYQGLRTHTASFVASGIPVSSKLAWFLSLSLPFVAFLATPAVLLYGVRLCGKHGFRDAAIMTLGLIGHVWLITLCGAVVLAKQVFGGHVEWKESGRSDV